MHGIKKGDISGSAVSVLMMSTMLDQKPPDVIYEIKQYITKPKTQIMIK